MVNAVEHGTPVNVLGPRERWGLLFALGLILVWGFSGSWEFPEKQQVRAAYDFKEEELQAVVAIPSTVADLNSPLAARGAELFQANGCHACHSLGEDRIIGPGLRGVYGSEQPMADGGTVLADEDYLRQSILEPQARIVAGYPSSMPSYEGLIDEAGLDALVEYLRSLQ